jgi:DNA-binding XRE family transcriptional regulator
LDDREQALAAASEFACVICGGDSGRPSWLGTTLFAGRRFEYLECDVCRSLICTPLPSDEVLGEMYGVGYDAAVSGEGPVSTDPVERVAGWLAGRPAGRFLDHGCGRGHFLTAVRGHRCEAPRRAPVEALETVSAEAPFSSWTARFPLEEAVALDLTSRVCLLIGLRGPDVVPAEPGVGEVVDDLTARHFLRRVRFYLNHPDEEHPLQRVMDAFELSKTELASLFGVRRQAVDQWLERGVPSERQEKVQTLAAICDLLERKLKPGRLAGVARRPADAYGGKTMLELIAADRHRELLELVRDSFDWASAA